MNERRDANHEDRLEKYMSKRRSAHGCKADAEHEAIGDSERDAHRKHQHAGVFERYCDYCRDEREQLEPEAQPSAWGDDLSLDRRKP